jgi:hypothetical protein
VTAARARNDIAGNGDIQFGYETAAPVPIEDTQLAPEPKLHKECGWK